MCRVVVFGVPSVTCDFLCFPAFRQLSILKLARISPAKMSKSAQATAVNFHPASHYLKSCHPVSRKTYVGPALCKTWQHDTFILEDIPVIPDLEDVQEEDMMTQIAAPPRCVIDMFHLEPFSISGYCVKKFPLKHQLMPRRRPRPHYAWGIWKRKFHSENASNVFRAHYAVVCTVIGHFEFVFEENLVR